MIYLYFDYKNLSNRSVNGYEIHDLDFSQLPELKVDSYTLARSDGEIVTNVNYGGKKILARGRVFAINSSELNTRLDTLKTWLTGINKPLDVEVNGAIRRFTATVSRFTTEISGYSCAFEIEFTTTGFASDINSTVLNFASPVSTAYTSHPNTFGGTATAYPALTFTVNMVTPYWSAKYLDIINAVLNQRMRINRTWAWGDVVAVDGSAKTVSIYSATKTVIDTCDIVTAWTSSHTIALDTTNMLEGVGCLTVTMAGAASTTTFERLNYATTISLPSTAGKVIIPIFIPTPTAGAVASVSFYIGKDATLAANYDYWTVSTQWNGTALATNAWNYLLFDMATAVSGTNGTPDRTAVKSLKVVINGTAATMRLIGARLDYMTLQKPSVTATTLDYEGTFVNYPVGSGTIVLSDEFTARNISVSGNYKKRYL